MSNKNIKVSLDVAAKIDSASKNLSSLQRQLSDFSFSSGLGKELESILKNSEKEIKKIQEKLSSGFVDSSDLSAIEKVFSRISSLTDALTKKTSTDGFASGGLKKDLETIVALEKAQKAYENSIAATEKKRESLNNGIENAKKAHADLLEQQKAQSTVTEKELNEQKALEELYRNQVNEAKKLRKEAQGALQAKIKESNGKYTEAQMSQKGSGLRKTDAFKNYMIAQSNYDKVLAQYQGAQNKTAGMVTKAMQLEAIKQAEDAIKAAELALENFNNDLGKTKEQEAFEKLKEQLAEINLEGLDIDLSDIKNVEDLKKKIDALSTAAGKKASSKLNEFKNTVDEVDEEVKDFGTTLDGARQEMDGLIDSANQQAAFESKIKQFLGMAGAAETLRRSLRSAFETIKELDATMTEMAVVTDLTVGDYWEQLPEYSKRASELGVSINSAYQAATLYYQQGLKSNEVTAISTETLKMAKIAGLSAADATDKMTAALRGFNMELNEASAQKISDVYSELAAITAADVDEISSAMTKTASIASSAGMEFETTAAFLSQIIETTRESAETAGTALKTVIARFQELKKAPSEIGEVDGEIIDANKIETALRSVGVSLRDTNGQFRDLDDVFLELSSKWDGLDTNTQRYIATIAAGSRQQSRFIAMMSDYSRTQELVTAANDSAGASQKQFEKTVESLGYKLEQLKNAWQEFSMGILNSELVKVGVDILTRFLEIINKATSAFDGLGGSIVKIMSVVALFKMGQKIFEKFKAPMMQFFSEIVSQSYQAGMNSGKAFAEGVKAAKDAEKEKSFQDKLDETMNKDESSALGKMVGYSKFQQGRNKFQEDGFKQDAENWAKMTYENEAYKNEKSRSAAIKQARKDKLQKVKDATSKVKRMDADNEVDKAGSEYKAARAEMDKAQKELVEFDETQTRVQQHAQEGWKQVGEGIQEMGSAISAVGIGLSMVGGILESMGLEGFGQGLQTVGNLLTMVGGAISALGTLVPIVTKVLVACGYSIQGAFWPILVIGLAIAALVGVIMGVIALIKRANDQKIENRMKAAAEATEKAKQSAEEAKDAYEELKDTIDNFGTVKNKFDGLISGTNEWYSALAEVNQEVLNLLETYPELAGFVTRGEFGELSISAEGFEAILAKQQEILQNASSNVAIKMAEENRIDQEAYESKIIKAKGQQTTYEYNDTAMQYLGKGGSEETIKETTDEGKANSQYYQAVVVDKTEELYQDMQAALMRGGNSMDIIETEMHTFVSTFEAEESEIRRAAQEMIDANNKINASIQMTVNSYKSFLTTQTSQDFNAYQYSDQILEAFSLALASDSFKNKVANSKTDADYLKGLFETYSVDYKDNKKGYQSLYKAQTGKDADESMTKKELQKEIVELETYNLYRDNMEKFAVQMQGMSGNDQRLIAGMLSSTGQGLNQSILEKIGATELNAKGEVILFKSDINDALQSAGTSLKDLAETLNITEEELFNNITRNVRNAIVNQNKAFVNLNKALRKDANDKIQQFGKEIELSYTTSADMANRLSSVMTRLSEEERITLFNTVNDMLEQAGADAEILAKYLSSANWYDEQTWVGFQDTLTSLGVSFNDTGAELTEFTTLIKKLGLATSVVDLKTVSNSVQSMANLLRDLKTGEQGYSFSQENYELLVKSNQGLKEQFVQLGDEFYYLGGAINDLTDTIIQTAAMLATQTAHQVEEQLQVSKSLNLFEESGANYLDKNLRLSDNNFADWSRNEKIAYLEQYRSFATGKSSEEGGVNTLAYVTDQYGAAIGMSLADNFIEYTDAKLDASLAGLKDLKDNNIELQVNSVKTAEDLFITTRSLQDPGDNAAYALQARQNNDEIMADRYSKALSIQAAQSEFVPNTIIGKYNELIDKELKDMSEKELNEMEKLEKSIITAIDRSSKTLDQIKTVNDLTLRVSEALYNIEQDKIDKLSEINSSIDDASSKLVDKIQEQINEARQTRENEKTKAEISDNQARLAYLMKDTSGGNALEILNLQKAIKEQQEGYSDSLVDQSLQELIDDNEKAAEQRQQQIEIMQAQLDYSKNNGDLTRQAEKITHESLAQISKGTDPLSTQLYDVLLKEEELNGKIATDDLLEQFKLQFIADMGEATDAYNGIEANTAAGAQEETLSSLNEWLKNQLLKEQKEQNAADLEEVRSENRAAFVERAANELKTQGGLTSGYSSLKDNNTVDEFYQKYAAWGGGSKEEFISKIKDRLGEVQEGIIPGVDFTGLLTHTQFGKDVGQWNQFKIGIDGVNQGDFKAKHVNRLSADEKITTLPGIGNAPSGSEQLALYQGDAYVGRGGYWAKIYAQNDNTDLTRLKNAMKAALNQYKAGGLADFTGPAWLDGTKSRPELVLNAKDTQNFIMLKDILADFMDNQSTTTERERSGGSGDNYYDVQINVDSIGSDYDVEQLAEKIRSLIYEDATYRNVNVVNLIR